MDWRLLIPAWYIVWSGLTFAAFALDKRRAGRGSRRIPERTLLILALLGGWPGALAGRWLFRHKTRKRWFTIQVWAITVLHVASWGAVAWARFQSGP